MSRYVKSLVLVGSVALATYSVGACRAIVGIEELDVNDDAGTSDAAASDARTNDARSDAAPDTGRTVDPVSQAKIEACKVTNCRQCCKQEFRDVGKPLEDHPTTKACFCGAEPGNCASECTAYCAGAEADTDCIRCIDDGLAGGRCTDACTSDACLDGLACVMACP